MNRSLYGKFEDIVCHLLEANGFNIETVQSEQSSLRFDILATFNGNTYAVEVKFYRTRRAQIALILRAATQLLAVCKDQPHLKPMLIFSSVLDPALRTTLEKQFGLTLFDRTDLFIWARKAPDIVDDLSIFLEQDTLALEGGTNRLEPQEQKPIQLLTSKQPDTRGTELCNRLKMLKKGRKTWAQYENICEEILKYLFEDELYGWHRQTRTDDDLNRFDYICRIKPSTEFWNFLLEHLHSRYVLFEFKNYVKRISQGQVLTTEKYLLERALRRVAIILTRTGAEKHAIVACQGAMRENGKLILVLDDDKVCELLHLKEKGDDPSDLLFEIADNFLMSLPR